MNEERTHAGLMALLGAVFLSLGVYRSPGLATTAAVLFFGGGGLLLALGLAGVWDPDRFAREDVSRWALAVQALFVAAVVAGVLLSV